MTDSGREQNGQTIVTVTIQAGYRKTTQSEEYPGYSQGIEVSGGQHVFYCAGQASVDANGGTAHLGDLRAQLVQALDNLEILFTQAGYTRANMVRLNYYTTDIDGLFSNWDVHLTRCSKAGIRPSSTLLGVARLAFSDLLVEIEATPVR